jgi:hypothetical protein
MSVSFNLAFSGHGKGGRLVDNGPTGLSPR